MVTAAIADELEQKGVSTIGALTRTEMHVLIDKKVIQPSGFDVEKINEVADTEIPSKRYCLCKNPVSAEADGKTREKLIELTVVGLESIANYKKSTSVEILGARVGKVLEKYKTGKYIDWKVQCDSQNKKSSQHKLVWSKKEELLAKAKELDGCYVITTKVTKDKMDTKGVVTNYKRLEQVEMAFRNLKTVQLEMRPVYHKLDDRIKAHVFLCMLAYYIQWHMQKRLEPLFKKNKKGWERRWTFVQVLETLKLITRNKIEVNGASFYRNTVPSKEQKSILALMGICM